MGRSPGAYRSDKRNKELARRKKQEEKRKRRLERAAGTAHTPQPPEALSPSPAQSPDAADRSATSGILE